MCCVSGILFIALPIPTIVSNFSAFYKDHLNKGKLQKLYNELEPDDSKSNSSVILVASSKESLYNVSTTPSKRVSISTFERHESYRRRLSTISGVGIGMPSTRIYPVNTVFEED